MHVALAIPINSETFKKSFYTMRRINTYSRSNMEQDRFTNLNITNIEKSYLIKYIINKFSEKERRMQI